MSEYDYRVKPEDLNSIGMKFDTLSKKQLLQLSELVADMKQSGEEEDLIDAKTYFNNAILPVLQEFGEMTYSLLVVEENDKEQIIVVSLKNQYGFDITESCRYMRGLFVVANHISINVEAGEVVMSLYFDYGEMCR